MISKLICVQVHKILCLICQHAEQPSYLAQHLHIACKGLPQNRRYLPRKAVHCLLVDISNCINAIAEDTCINAISQNRRYLPRKAVHFLLVDINNCIHAIACRQDKQAEFWRAKPANLHSQLHVREYAANHCLISASALVQTAQLASMPTWNSGLVLLTNNATAVIELYISPPVNPTKPGCLVSAWAQFALST